MKLKEYIQQEVKKQLLKEEDEINYTQIIEDVNKALPELEKLIYQRIKTKVKLKVELSRKNRIQITSDNIVSNLGNTLVKTLFTEMEINFWGGEVTQNKTSVWFAPKVWYGFPTGGTNGTDFIWDNIWFMLDSKTWKEGRVIFK